MTVEAVVDPFPRDRFLALVRRLPSYARLAWRLGRDGRIPGRRRTALLAGAAYLASPIDLVPGFIPVAGQLDDAAAVLVTLRIALNGLSVDERRIALAGVDIAEEDMSADLRTIGATYAWLGRRGARLAWRGARVAGRAARRVGSRLAAKRTR